MIREENQNCAARVLYDSAEVYILIKTRTIEVQIAQKRKNEPPPKFTGSYKKKRVSSIQLGRMFDQEFLPMEQACYIKLYRTE